MVERLKLEMLVIYLGISKLHSFVSFNLTVMQLLNALKAEKMAVDLLHKHPTRMKLRQHKLKSFQHTPYLSLIQFNRIICLC